MIKNFLKIFLSLLWLPLCGQNNMVDNPGFENSTLNPCTSCEPPTIAHQLYADQYSYWLKTFPWTIPDKAALAKMVGSPDLECPVAGHGRVGFTIDNEFLFQQFQNGAMVSGHIYYLEFKYNAASGNNQTAGITFLSKRSKQWGDGGILRHPWPCTANLQIPTSNFDGQWHTASCYWPAGDNFPWLLIGNVDNNGGPAIRWDDFKVIDVGESECPSTNYIQNQTFANIDGIIYKSKHLTYSDNTTIQNTAWVVFKSEQEVALMPGFHTDPGSKFDAIIAPCTDGPCLEPSPFISSTDEFCSMAGQQAQLGGPAIGNTTYQWSGSCSCGTPISTLLGSTTVSNPVLTIPSGSGSINLSEVVTSGCSSQSHTGHGVLFYDDNPDSNPTVSASPSNITLTSSNSHPSFTIQGNSHTEVVYIELYDANNNLINSWPIDNFPANQQGSFQYVFTDLTSNFAPCNTYHYNIYSENICYEGTQSPIATVNVSTANPITITLQPNIITPDCNGCNDWFCWGVNGASNYDAYIYDSNGNLYCHNTGQTGQQVQWVCNNQTVNTYNCIWEGNCCGGSGTTCTNPGSGPSHTVADGTYYYVVTWSNCQTSTTSHGFLTLLGDPKCTYSRLANPGLSDSLKGADLELGQYIQEQKNNARMAVYPSPAENTLNINFDASAYDPNNPFRIQIYDSQGKLVYEKNEVPQYNIINVSALDPGVYTAVSQNNLIKLRKVFIIE